MVLGPDGTYHKRHCLVAKLVQSKRENQELQDQAEKKQAAGDDIEGEGEGDEEEEEKKTKKRRKRKAPSNEDDEEDDEEPKPKTTKGKGKAKKPKAKKARTVVMHKFGELEFTSFKRAIDFCKEILEQQTPCEYVPGDRNYGILADIFRRQTAYAEMKFTCIGFRKGEKGKGSYQKYSSFYVKTADGMTYSINYRDCLKAVPTQVKLEPPYKTAFQNAVKASLRKFRTTFFKSLGKQTNEAAAVLSGAPLVNKKKNSEIIYEGPTFDELLARFLEEEKLTVDSLSSKYMLQANRSVEIVCPNMKGKWILFHELNAKLKVVVKQGKGKAQNVISSPSSTPSVASTPSVQELTSNKDESTGLVVSQKQTLHQELGQLCQKISLPVDEQNFGLKGF